MIRLILLAVFTLLLTVTFLIGFATGRLTAPEYEPDEFWCNVGGADFYIRVPVTPAECLDIIETMEAEDENIF